MTFLSQRQNLPLRGFHSDAWDLNWPLNKHIVLFFFAFSFFARALRDTSRKKKKGENWQQDRADWTQQVAPSQTDSPTCRI